MRRCVIRVFTEQLHSLQVLFENLIKYMDPLPMKMHIHKGITYNFRGILDCLRSIHRQLASG